MLSLLEQVDREHPVHNLLFSIIHESRGEQYLLIISEQANQCVQKALCTCVVHAIYVRLDFLKLGGQGKEMEEHLSR